MSNSKRPRRTFTPEFKNQLVQLYKGGKSKHDITEEYDIGYSTLYKWIQQDELVNIRKQYEQLLMENNILKKAVFILGEK